MSHISATLLVLITVLMMRATQADEIPEIRIISSVEEMITLYTEADYWGELDPDKILDIPPILVVVTVKLWQKEAAAMTIQGKKELFYRSLLPLIVYSNNAIAQERIRLLAITDAGVDQGRLSDVDTAWLLNLGIRYGVIKSVDDEDPEMPKDSELRRYLDELLVRVDTVPASASCYQLAVRKKGAVLMLTCLAHSSVV